MANWSANPSEVCLGEEIQFNDLSNPLNNTITSWSWDFGDGSGSGQRNPAHIYSRASSFSVKMYYTTSIGCNSDTIGKTVTAHPIPVVNAGPDLFILQGGQLPIQATAIGGDLTYLWTPATWLSNATVIQPFTSAQNDILYTLTVTGSGGCKASDSVFVKVLLNPVIPNAFSPNGDGINDTWIIRYIDSYPGATIQIFDRYGRNVFRSTGYNQPWNGTVNGSPVPAGVYYFIVDPKNGLKPISGSVTVIR
jgi:gliding motility-associated-like protein